MAEGAIVEDGSHEQLLQRGGIYANFYRHQLLREQKDEQHDDEAQATEPSDGDEEQP